MNNVEGATRSPDICNKNNMVLAQNRQVDQQNKVEDTNMNTLIIANSSKSSNVNI